MSAALVVYVHSEAVALLFKSASSHHFVQEESFPVLQTISLNGSPSGVDALAVKVIAAPAVRGSGESLTEPSVGAATENPAKSAKNASKIALFVKVCAKKIVILQP